MKLPLKQLREDRGITQSELSKALKISPSTVGMWEQGRREPDYEMLSQIADYFNVSTDYLLGRKSTPAYLSKKQSTLLGTFDMLNVEGQNLIMKLVRALSMTYLKDDDNVIISNANNGSNFGVVGGNFNSNVTIR